jgi:hypothetical protein
MSEKKITILIGKAIREGKYLNITYKNREGDFTLFWICILDINAKGELKVNMFNVTKEDPLYNAKIYISCIKSADILKFSHYDVPTELIKKLENDDGLQAFEFDRYDNNILNYCLECYRANKDPFLYKHNLINEIDLYELQKYSPYQLSDDQQKQVVKEIYHNDYKKFYDYELAICEFSIDLSSKAKFVVAYRKITFDPVNKTLHLGVKTLFNPNFYINGVKHSLSYYTDMSPVDFEAWYLKDKSEAIEMLIGNFKSGELPNTRPEVVVLGYAQIDISPIYDSINDAYEQKDLGAPLRAFFQNLSLLDRQNRSEPHIVLFDRNINIDQIRAIYNALKFPITYVQGPPGTGKTQAIINIIVNSLTNSKTLLISSNNNVPIDGIKDKLSLGTYRNKEILLPVLRLGNNDLVAKALDTIKELHAFETKDVPKEEMLFNLKERSKENNRKLQVKIKNFETAIQQQENLKFVKNLLDKAPNYLLEKEKEIIEEKLKNQTEIRNDDLDNMYEVIKENHQLLQFYYFESLRYIKRLKGKDYTQLIEITAIENENAKVKEFNKWIADDENMEKLTKVFPIILTTNISSRKLGRTFKFDLLVMDEAGQCDIATSLIPISKCRNMLLLGDTNQLKPIVMFEESRNQQLMRQFSIDKPYDYYNNSILSLYKSIDNISSDILLSYHYRCGKKIINYSNMRFYENKLKLPKIQKTGEVKLLDVNNINQKYKNANIEEAKEIIRYIADNKLTDVFT